MQLVDVIMRQTASATLEDPSCETHYAAAIVPTAQTTVLLANEYRRRIQRNKA
jgi:hypothetical protein